MASWRFVGRVDELIALNAAAIGQSGRGLVVGGVPGVGKSRLLREAVTAVDADRIAVWSAAGSVATSGLPYGSLATVLPLDHPIGAAPAALLRWGLDSLHDEAGGRRMMLAIDDLHLADPLSAALIALVARSDRATVLATVRTGEPLPETVAAVWKDDLADRIELPPFTRSETAEVLRGVLDGGVDSAAIERLHQLSQGNASLLREMVLEGLAHGDFTEVYGLWRWTGRPRLDPSLVDLVDSRVGPLPEALRGVIELVAFGEPLGLDLLMSVADTDAVELAEERHLIDVVGEGWQSAVRLSLPLYGEIVRRRCPVTRARRLQARLADLAERSGSPDPVRLASWRLESQTVHNADQLLAAGREAFSCFDIPLALRLLTAARQNGDPFEAAELLAWLHTMSGGAANGQQVLEEVRGEATTDARLARWHAARAAVRHWGLRLPAAANELASISVRSTSERAWLTAVEAMIRLHRTESVRSERLAQSVLDCVEAQGRARALARVTLAHLEALRGSATRAADDLAAVEANAWQWKAEAPQVHLALTLARGAGLILSADLSGVDALASDEYRRWSLADDQRLGSAFINIIAGQAARLRGRVNEATRHQRTACGKLVGTEFFASLAHAERAHAAALAGDREEAELAMAEADRLYDPCVGVLYPWLEHARCWVQASAGNLDEASTHSQALAVRLIDDTFFAHAAIALHDVVRFGRPELVVGQLTRLVGLVEGPVVDVMARHARAAAEGDSDELLAVADSFGRLGLNLHGAEAAACAFSRLRELRSSHAAEATSVMAALLDRCEDSHTPGLIVDRPTLTAREAQIARLAAAGLTSKDIAGQLYLSARTIDNHLRRIYAKLGVSGRGELSGALSTVVNAG